MPGVSRQVFKSQNDFSQLLGGLGGAHGKGTRAYGICFAMTSLWCRNMLEGRRALLSQPDYHLGETVHTQYRMDGIKTQDWDQAKLNRFTALGLSGTKVVSSQGARVCQFVMSTNPGVYLVSNGSHILGFMTGGPFYSTTAMTTGRAVCGSSTIRRRGRRRLPSTTTTWKSGPPGK